MITAYKTSSSLFFVGKTGIQMENQREANLSLSNICDTDSRLRCRFRAASTRAQPTFFFL
jgi:hypothetical protein